MRDTITNLKESRQRLDQIKSEDNLSIQAIKSQNLSNLLKHWNTMDSNTFVILIKSLITKVNVRDDLINIQLKTF